MLDLRFLQQILGLNLHHWSNIHSSIKLGGAWLMGFMNG